MPEHMTRAEHLQWAKDRALAYLDPPKVASVNAGTRGEPGYTYTAIDGREYSNWPPAATLQQMAAACASILSDLRKHPEIDPSAADMVFAMEAFNGGMNTVEKVRHFIEGIN